MDKRGKAMDKIGPHERQELLSQQVSGTRYFFVDLAPANRRELVIALGGREHCNADYLIRRRRYAYTVLEIVEAGEGWLELEGRREPLQPGSVYAVGPRMPCEIVTSATDPLVKYFICLAGAPCAARLGKAGVAPGRSTRVTPVAEITSSVDDLIREGQQEGAHVRKICQHLLEIMLLKIEMLAAATGGGDDPARARFLRCKALIDRDAENLGTLRDIAAMAGLEESSVCRLFRRYQGTSPYQYLLRRKMNLAAEHLMQHGGLVKEAAERVGFADPYHFSRVFKAVHGVAPREIGRIAPRRAL